MAMVASAAVALCCLVAIAFSRERVADSALEYVVPGPTKYNANGAYPVPSDPDPAASLRPAVYRMNGQFPEVEEPNPAGSLVPLVYRGECCLALTFSRPAHPPVAAIAFPKVKLSCVAAGNGQYPEPLPPNPAEGLIPLVYKGNGQFPEAEAPNPADGLVPMQYFDNGDDCLFTLCCAESIVHAVLRTSEAIFAACFPVLVRFAGYDCVTSGGQANSLKPVLPTRLTASCPWNMPITASTPRPSSIPQTG